MTFDCDVVRQSCDWTNACKTLATSRRIAKEIITSSFPIILAYSENGREAWSRIAAWIGLNRRPLNLRAKQEALMNAIKFILAAILFTGCSTVSPRDAMQQDID